MKNNNTYFLLWLEERNGEYEYIHRSVHELPDGQMATANRIAEDYAKDFYGEETEEKDGGYYFFGGEVFVKVGSLRFISEEHFNILRQYL